MATRTLVFGPGFMGSQFAQRIEGSILSRVDIADEQAVTDEIASVRPDRVINCAGKTGKPNVDGCEKEPEATYRSNVVGPIVLANACRKQDIHFTHLGSGCIYQGDNGGHGFREDDPANFFGSLYSRTKAISESALRDLGALQLRIRMPLSSHPSSRNLLTKLLGYARVISIPNSVTVVEDFWHPALSLIERGETGVWNLCNPGAELHDELLKQWQERVEPDYRFDVIPLETLARYVTTGRSNCVLNTDKLREAGLEMPHIDVAMPRVVEGYGRATAHARAS